MRITIDSALRYRIDDETANPLVFEPEVDWQRFGETNIISTY